MAAVRGRTVVAAGAPTVTAGKVLVTTVDPEAQGGVSAFWNAVGPFLGPSAEYFVVGRRHRERGAARIAARILADWGRLRRVLDAGGFDLVHLNPSLGPKALLRDAVSLAMVRRRGVRSLVFLHGWDPQTEALLEGHWLSLFRRTYLRADGIIVLAREFEDRLRRMGYAGPIYVATTAVPEHAFDRAPADGPRPEGVRLLYLSRIEPRKGAAEAIRAFALLEKRHPGVTLTLAGVGPELPSLSALIRDLGLTRARLVGQVTGAMKTKVFADADIFVFPTLYGEGMPTVVLEAMAQGLPIVTRPVGGIADFFESGRMGYSTPSEDPAVIASFVERLVVDPDARRAMGEYNREFARRRFHASVVADRLTSIHEEMMARPAPPKARS